MSRALVEVTRQHQLAIRAYAFSKNRKMKDVVHEAIGAFLARKDVSNVVGQILEAKDGDNVKKDAK